MDWYWLIYSNCIYIYLYFLSVNYCWHSLQKVSNLNLLYINANFEPLNMCKEKFSFFFSGRDNILLTTDEEQLESTNAIRSIPLTFNFITGSTSSSLCRERVVPTSCPLSHFPDILMPHILVACAATAFCLLEVEGGPTGTRGRTRHCLAAAATGSSTSTSSVMRARALAYLF